MRTLLSAAMLTALTVGAARADTIKTFDAQITLGGVNQYGFVVSGTIGIDTTTETFTAIDLGLTFITSFFQFDSIASQSSTATDISFTAISPAVNPVFLVVSIAKSTFGANPSDYGGGPIDPAGTYFYIGAQTIGSYTPPASEQGVLTFVNGSTVTTPSSSVPEPATLGLLGAVVLMAGGVRARARRG